MVLNFLTNHIVNFINKYHPTDKESTEVLHYGIYITILNIFDLIFIFFIAAAFNILNYVLIAFISFNVLRLFAGGVHAKTPLTCLLVSSCILLGIPAVVMYVPIFYLLKYILFALSLILLMIYSPADVSEKPITSGSHLKTLKILSVLYTAALFVASFFTKNITGNIMALGTLCESLSILPAVDKLTKSNHGNESHII